jgi:hypothetical protein
MQITWSETGPQGEPGIQGIPGEQAIQGVPGEQGIQGTPGADGAPGPGLSLERLAAGDRPPTPSQASEAFTSAVDRVA